MFSVLQPIHLGLLYPSPFSYPWVMQRKPGNLLLLLIGIQPSKEILYRLNRPAGPRLHIIIPPCRSHRLSVLVFGKHISPKAPHVLDAQETWPMGGTFTSAI